MEKFRIEVVVYGETLTAVSDGTEEGTIFTGNKGYINMAKASIRRGRKVDITHSRKYDSVVAGYGTPIALAAALCSVDEMRSIIYSAPEQVRKFIQNGDRRCSNFTIEDIIDDQFTRNSHF